MKLEEARKQIDVIDKQLLKLFNERMELAKEIAYEKRKNNLAVTNKQREKNIINNMVAGFDDRRALYIKKFFSNIFNISKSYQTELINESSLSSNKISKLINEGPLDFPIKANIACQGLPGSYSSIVAERVFDIANITYFKDFRAVFAAVEAGLCEYGILPIENSSAGSVKDVYDLMAKHKFSIVHAYRLKVEHNLLSKKNVDIKNIKEIISHEQAIMQCSDFLDTLKDIKISYVANTALAAKIVSESDRDDLACLSSKECMEIYNLHAVRKVVQDNDNNYTRFIVISKQLKLFKGANKINIKVELEHSAGSLNRLMNEFAIRGINLTKLESRPQAKSLFEFSFYFDFEGDVINDGRILNAIAVIENQVESFELLGCYKEN